MPAPLEDGNGGYLAFIVAYGALEELLVFCEKIFVSFHNPILDVEIFTTHLSQMRHLKVMEGVGPLRVIWQFLLLLNSSVDTSYGESCITFHMLLI